MDLPKVINELTGLVTAIGIIVLGILQYLKWKSDNANNKEVKKILVHQNDDLETIRVDVEQSKKTAVEVKQDLLDTNKAQGELLDTIRAEVGEKAKAVEQFAVAMKEAATEVKHAAVEVAKAAVSKSSPDLTLANVNKDQSDVR